MPCGIYLLIYPSYADSILEIFENGPHVGIEKTANAAEGTTYPDRFLSSSTTRLLIFESAKKETPTLHCGKTARENPGTGQYAPVPS